MKLSGRKVKFGTQHTTHSHSYIHSADLNCVCVLEWTGKDSRCEREGKVRTQRLYL